MAVEAYDHNVCDVGSFFFQAEDGIRDYKVTGVQTCALPISLCGDIERTVRNGCRTAPAERSRNASAMAGIKSFMRKRFRTSSSLKMIGLVSMEIGRASCRERV